MGINFGGWPEELHETEDQQKRIASAKKAETTPSSIDRETQTGVFPGSGKNPYQTSLTRCSCQFFRAKGVPCKHMYRLAMELGLMDADFKTGVNKNIVEADRFTWREAVDELEKLPESCQRFIQKNIYLMHYGGKPSTLVDLTGDLAPLQNCPLIECKTPSIQQILEKYKKAEITELIIGFGFEVPKMKKSDLIEWCAENVPNIRASLPSLTEVSFSPRFEKASHKTYSYLRRKYNWDLFTDGVNEYRYPHGAQLGQDAFKIVISEDGITIPDWDSNRKYYYPDDEMTKYLNKYNCNRCKDGFTPEIVQAYDGQKIE